jgi:hypothetical protein
MTHPAIAETAPPPRWERLNAAAARLGIPRDVLLSSIETGQAPIRVIELGRRALVHVAVEDVDAWRSRLAYGGIR